MTDPVVRDIARREGWTPEQAAKAEDLVRQKWFLRALTRFAVWLDSGMQEKRFDK